MRLAQGELCISKLLAYIMCNNLHLRWVLSKQIVCVSNAGQLKRLINTQALNTRNNRAQKGSHVLTKMLMACIQRTAYALPTCCGLCMLHSRQHTTLHSTGDLQGVQESHLSCELFIYVPESVFLLALKWS